MMIMKDAERARDSLAKILVEKNVKIVFAESCTGGLCSALMAQVSGISNHLCGSSVTYRPETKKKWLGVPRKEMEQHTCESASIAAIMARQVLLKTPEADWSAAIVGHLEEVGEGRTSVWISIYRKDEDKSSFVHEELGIQKDTTNRTRMQRQYEAALFVLRALELEITKRESDMLIWTEGCQPFVMGGNVNDPIGTNISRKELGSPVDLPMGFQAYEFENPNNGATHIIEAESGAFIGDDLQAVCDDIEKCADREMMEKQISNAKQRRKEVKPMEPEKFWGLFR